MSREMFPMPSEVEFLHNGWPRTASRVPSRIIPSKPLDKVFQRDKRLRTRLMTIGIGMLCEGGIVIAADTQMTYTDGTTHDRVKIKTLRAVTCTYVITFSCSEANPAEALANDILLDLKLSDPKSPFGVEDVIKTRLETWADTRGLKDERPYVAFVLGVRFPPENADPFALYLCESPGTVLRKTAEDSNGYVAIGAGSVVTDPLFRTLFGSLAYPRICLAQLSYLMYRAKKDCRGACGGDTDAVLLSINSPDPLWIDRTFMRVAETHGRQLDKALARVASTILARNGRDDESRFAKLFDPKAANSLFGLPPVFRARTGEIIRED
jgi:hypothetical protein